MRDQPSGADLLDTALDVFQNKLLAAVPRELRYDALMVKNAMAVVARQVEAGEQPLLDAQRRLCTFYPDEDPATMERRLTSDIRQGRFDPGEPDRHALFDHLWKATRAKAAESAPKALQDRPE